MRSIITLGLAALLLCVLSCQKEKTPVSVEIGVQTDDILNHVDVTALFSTGYGRAIKPYLSDLGVPNAVVDNNKAQLGRLLFYDKNLSSDRTISCASCHKQEYAFGDNQALTPGVEGAPATRNSMALGNVASFGGHYSPINGQSPQLLWDGRAATVAEQAPLAFSHPHEMNMSMEALNERVKSLGYYRYIVERVYGDQGVTTERLMESLQHFVNAIGSSNSKLDKALEEFRDEKIDEGLIQVTTVQIINQYYGTTITTTLEPMRDFSEGETRGRTIFAQNCTKCHSPIRAFQEVFMACNGLEMEYHDEGLGGVSNKIADRGVFKSGSLRNIALTAPYMHDGRFATLEEVVEFYSSGINNHENLHPLLRNADGTVGKNFTQQQKADLVAYMKTMTDMGITTDKRFSNPFIK
jgi:cytochrome c peroxidase